MRKLFIKKAAAVFTAAATVCALVGGCGGNGKNAEPVSIEIWHYYNGALQSSFDRMITRFNETVGAEKGITVSAHSQGSIAELETAIKSAADKQIGSGELPDIFASYADTAYEIHKTGVLANIDLYFTPEEQAEYVDAYIQEGRVCDEDGELFIFPIAKCTETFMLNKTDWEPFAAATGASYEDMRTAEGVAETARKYYEWTDSLTPDIPNDGRAFYGRDALANLFIIGSKQMGHEIFRAENGKVTADIDETAIRRIWDVYYLPYIKGYYATGGKYRSDDAKVGNIISLIGSTSSAGYFPTEVADSGGSHSIEAEILPMPMFEGGSPVTVQQGAGMVVTKSTPEREEAAVTFLKWFTETDNNIVFSAESGYLPVKKEANDYEFYKATAERLGVEIDRVNDKVIREAFNTVANTELYTTRAFDGCQKARSILKYSLADKAEMDRALIKDKLEQGVSLEEAIEPFDTDENFKEWFGGFKDDINGAISAAS